MPSNRKSPKNFKLVLRSLFSNYFALFSASFICLCIIFSISGHILLPDKTPNANDGAVQISKQLPGFQVKMLKVRKNISQQDKGFFNNYFVGKESKHLIVPIQGFKVRNGNVYVKVYRGDFVKYSLLNIVKPLDVSMTYSLFSEDEEALFTNGDTITYYNVDQNLMKVAYNDLVTELVTKNIEKRTFVLGTDKSGRDFLSRLLFGARISLLIGAISVVISSIIGVLIGSIAGYFSGWVDKVALWLMSVVWSIPGIMLVIAISLALNSRGIWVAFVAVGFTTWVEVARIVRGQVISVKEKSFIEAARAFGFSDVRIIYKHILPNVLGPIIVIATANFASAILLEAGLSFLGLGVQPPTPSWGVMIYEGYNSIGTKNGWYLILFPGLMISLLVLSFNILGNSLRDALDPRLMLVKAKR